MPLTPIKGYRPMLDHEVIGPQTKMRLAGYWEAFNPSVRFHGWTFAKRKADKQDPYNPEMRLYMMPDSAQPPWQSVHRLPPNKIAELPLP